MGMMGLERVVAGTVGRGEGKSNYNKGLRGT
jgi:hypothetical protein